MRNLALGRQVTTSESPNATYPNHPIDVIRTGDADWGASAGHFLTFGHQPYRETVLLDRGYVGFDSGTDITFVLDLATAQSGSFIRTCGYFGTDSIDRPLQVKVESSDDNAAWTPVDDLDGLTAGGAPGIRLWFAEVDISAAGSHRYWRLTLQRDPDWLFVSYFEFWG